MIRIVFFFSLGILAALHSPVDVPIELATIILTTGVVGYMIFLVVKPTGAWGALTGALGLMLVALLGVVRLTNFSDRVSPDHLTYYQGEVKHYVARVVSSSVEKRKTWRYEVELQRIDDGTTWLPASGRALLYIAKTDNPTLSYGDEVLIAGAPKAIEAPRNPRGFDLRQYFEYQHIYYQHIVGIGQVQKLPLGAGRDLLYYAYAARSWAAAQLKTYVPEGRPQAIALALALGISDNLGDELRQAYAASGAMHVLAVSGLHVGILYGIIMLLLLPLRFVSWGRWVTAVSSIVLLWLYAFLTGLSPSVLRAVTMFSFVALAPLFGRQTNVYTTMAGSAFLLLLFNPYLIVSVGFQLSYLALLGIVSLYRPLYLLWTPRIVVLDWVWRISCVSISAQLATAPLALFYFHQLPVYFLLSGLVVLPAAPVVLLGSIAVILSGGMPVIASFLGMLLQGVIELMNKGIFLIEALPNSVVDRVYITPAQCWLLVAILVFAVLLFRHKKFSYMILLAIGIVAFSFSRWVYIDTVVRPGWLVVYALPNETAVEWIQQGMSRFYSDYEHEEDDQTLKFNVAPNRIFHGICETCTDRVWMSGDEPIKIFYAGGKRVAIVKGSISAWPTNMHVDILVLGNQSFPSLRAVRKKISFEQLILSSDNSKAYCERMLSEDGDSTIYSVPHWGAYVVRL